MYIWVLKYGIFRLIANLYFSNYFCFSNLNLRII